MTTISEINAAIQRANNEIEKCNSLKTAISELSENIIYCTRKFLTEKTRKNIFFYNTELQRMI